MSLRKFLEQNGIDTQTKAHQIYVRDNQLLIAQVSSDFAWNNLSKMPVLQFAENQGLEEGLYYIWNADHSEKFLATNDFEINKEV